MAGLGSWPGGRELRRVQRSLRSWLIDSAYPLWWERGADRINGGFHARLQLDGAPMAGEPRRARLNPRQVFSYSNASSLGWPGPAEAAVRHGLGFFLSHFRRADGLVRACVAPDGVCMDDKPVLYDQAFALLGFAAAFAVLRDASLTRSARELHDRLHALLGHASGGFAETPSRNLPLSSNSHMHLLEASLAWATLDPDTRWLELARKIVRIALTRCVDARTGALREHFDDAWRPLGGERGRIVEPGHQFEWAWLLLRFHAHDMDPALVAAALRLIEIGERHGVDAARGVALNTLRDDFTVLDSEARLWPQTERLKAACAAAALTGKPEYLQAALAAANALQGYLAVPMQGLWRDRQLQSGEFVDEPAPASSMYHIVGAVAALQRAAETFPAT